MSWCPKVIAYSAVVFFALNGEVRADLPEYSVTGRVEIGPENVVIFPCGNSVPMLCAHSNTDDPLIGGGPGYGSVTVTADSVLPDPPDTKIKAEVDTEPLQGADAQAEFIYYFTATAYNSRVTPLPKIGIHFNSNLSFTTPYTDAEGDSAGGSASVEVSDPDGNVLLREAEPGEYSNSLSLTPYSIYFVDIFANAYAGSFGFDRSADALVDPTITVDPQYADDYYIQYSPGLLAAGAPEPASWGMILIGFGGLGILMRSRRRLIYAPRYSK
jgi:PEP-CTERM motif